jgi:hypothetical protein
MITDNVQEKLNKKHDTSQQSHILAPFSGFIAKMEIAYLLQEQAFSNEFQRTPKFPSKKYLALMSFFLALLIDTP